MSVVTVGISAFSLRAHARCELGLSEKLLTQEAPCRFLAPCRRAVHTCHRRASRFPALPHSTERGVSAKSGGSLAWLGAGRVTLWGALAMVATAGIGILFGP